MACGCENIECLEIVQNMGDCPSSVILDLEADQTGTWTVQYEFNGFWKGFEIEVQDGENIELPAVFNEFYKHTLKIFNSAGELFNDTCYSLDTGKIINYKASPQTDEDMIPVQHYDYTIVADPDENDASEQPVGFVITDARLVGAIVTTVEFTGQSYNRKFFVKNKTSNTLTMNQPGPTFAEDDVITVYYKRP